MPKLKNQLNTSKIKIETDIPMPSRMANKYLQDIKLAIQNMNIGDSFEIELNSWNSLVWLRTYAKRIGRKIAARSLNKTKFRIWRIK